MLFSEQTKQQPTLWFVKLVNPLKGTAERGPKLKAWKGNTSSTHLQLKFFQLKHQARASLAPPCLTQSKELEQAGSTHCGRLRGTATGQKGLVL